MVDPSSAQTPEEVLETEIEELEKRTLNSAWLWVAAAVGLIALFSATFLIANWDHNQSSARPLTVVPEAMLLKEPLGRSIEISRFVGIRWTVLPRTSCS
jgi:hypothetical protein